MKNITSITFYCPDISGIIIEKEVFASCIPISREKCTEILKNFTGNIIYYVEIIGEDDEGDYIYGNQTCTIIKHIIEGNIPILNMMKPTCFYKRDNNSILIKTDVDGLNISLYGEI